MGAIVNAELIVNGVVTSDTTYVVNVESAEGFINHTDSTNVPLVNGGAIVNAVLL